MLSSLKYSNMGCWPNIYIINPNIYIINPNIYITNLNIYHFNIDLSKIKCNNSYL